MVRGIANSKIGFGDLILLLRYFFKLKVSTHPNKLEEYDSNSTMFRYPISMDKNLDYQKSTFKKCNLVKGKTPKESKSESKSKIFLLVHNGNDEIIESYVSDNEVLSEIHEVLKELSEQLSGLHFGLKFDLIR